MKNFFTRKAFAPLIVAAGAALLAMGAFLLGTFKQPSPQKPPAEKNEVATSEQVHSFCAACHGYPPADTFPREHWRREVARGFEFFNQAKITKPSFRAMEAPDFESVVRYYENRAPASLKRLTLQPSPGPLPVAFAQTGQPLDSASPGAAIANVNLVHLSDDRKLDLIACDMRGGKVVAMKPYEASPAWKVLGKVPHPAHAEVVDLDDDGIKDILVANLGSFTPTDDPVGSVVLLKGKSDGTYTPITLLKDVGRVADVQAADFNGDGKLDLIVAVFGLYTSGKILFLENKTTDWANPIFVPHVVDARQGAIHVPVAYLNGDKKRPDFVAVISQEHETVVAFLNEGKGHFRKEIIYQAPHPAFGSTGIQLVDINGDGRQDVLLTNGDVLDPPHILKPYHGITWLENRGTYPFFPHHLTAMYGVHRAVAADITGTGKMDIVAVSFLPAEYFPEAKERQLDSVILLEQTKPGKFIRHSLEKGTCDHATCALGAWNGDGRIHLATAHFASKGYAPPHGITLWHNGGKAASKREASGGR
jgi:hypothetical protein